MAIFLIASLGALPAPEPMAHLIKYTDPTCFSDTTMCEFSRCKDGSAGRCGTPQYCIDGPPNANTFFGRNEFASWKIIPPCQGIAGSEVLVYGTQIPLRDLTCRVEQPADNLLNDSSLVACTENVCQNNNYKKCIMTENPCATDHIPVDVTSEGAFCLPVDSCGTGTQRKLGGTSVMQLGTYVFNFNPTFDEFDPDDAGLLPEPSCPPGYSNLPALDCYMILNYAVTRNLQNAGFDNYSVINSQTYTVPLQQDIYVEVFDLDNTSTRQNILTLFPDWAPHIKVTSESKSTIIPPT